MSFDLVKYSIKNVIKRRLRSGLTILSILIGVTAIFTLVSFGVGLQNYVDILAQDAGVDKIFIQSRGIGAPGTDNNFFLTQDDTDFVEKINGVQDITGIYSNIVETKKDRQAKYVFLIGIDPSKTDLVDESFTVEIESGRQLKNGDTDKAVLGYNYQENEKVFDKGVVIGEKIELNGNKFDVVGFYNKLGNPQDDSNIYITYESFETLFPEKKDNFGFIMVKSNRNVDLPELAEKINDRLRKHKGQEKGKEDFFVQTFDDALQTFNSVILVLNGILFLIALISVIVAGVNTTNTMYTAVLERTKEIGIMKAVGAKNSSVLFIYVFESGILGSIGGILGVILGFLISSGAGFIAAQAGFSFLKPSFPLWLTLGSILFSFIVGAGSGLLPAIRASKLRIVNALRYE
jgi:putative ABC transport system permease protein